MINVLNLFSTTRYRLCLKVTDNMKSNAYDIFSLLRNYVAIVVVVVVVVVGIVFITEKKHVYFFFSNSKFACILNF